MKSLEERVRAAPALDGTVAGGFGWLSWGLGLSELLAPRALLRFLGLDPNMAPLVRGFGLREITSGVGILQNPVGPQYMWSRVLGDVIDIAALGTALRSSRKPQRVALALGVVAGITVLDIVMSARLSQLSASKQMKRVAR